MLRCNKAYPPRPGPSSRLPPLRQALQRGSLTLSGCQRRSSCPTAWTAAALPASAPVSAILPCHLLPTSRFSLLCHCLPRAPELTLRSVCVVPHALGPAREDKPSAAPSERGSRVKRSVQFGRLRRGGSAWPARLSWSAPAQGVRGVERGVLRLCQPSAHASESEQGRTLSPAVRSHRGVSWSTTGTKRPIGAPA